MAKKIRKKKKEKQKSTRNHCILAVCCHLRGMCFSIKVMPWTLLTYKTRRSWWNAPAVPFHQTRSSPSQPVLWTAGNQHTPMPEVGQPESSAGMGTVRLSESGAGGHRPAGTQFFLPAYRNWWCGDTCVPDLQRKNGKTENLPRSLVASAIDSTWCFTL